jgi:hypothetical protein
MDHGPGPKVTASLWKLLEIENIGPTPDLLNSEFAAEQDGIIY